MKSQFLKTLKIYCCLSLLFLVVAGTTLAAAAQEAGESTDQLSYNYHNVLHYVNDTLMVSAVPVSDTVKNAYFFDQQGRIDRIVAFMAKPDSDVERLVKEKLERCVHELILFIENTLLHGKPDVFTYKKEELIPLSKEQASALQKLCSHFVHEFTTLYDTTQELYNLPLQDCLCFFETAAKQSNQVPLETRTRSWKRFVQEYGLSLLVLSIVLGTGTLATHYSIKKKQLDQLDDQVVEQAKNLIKETRHLPPNYYPFRERIIHEQFPQRYQPYDEKPFCTSCLKERIEKLKEHNQRLALCKKLVEIQSLIPEENKNSSSFQTSCEQRYLEYKKRGLGAFFVEKMERLMNSDTFHNVDQAIKKLRELTNNPRQAFADCTPQELAANIRNVEKAYTVIAQENTNEDRASFSTKFDVLYSEAVDYVRKLARASALLKNLPNLQSTEASKNHDFERLKSKLLHISKQSNELHDLDKLGDDEKEDIIQTCLALEKITLPQEHYDLWEKALSFIPNASRAQFKYIVDKNGAQFLKEMILGEEEPGCPICCANNYQTPNIMWYAAIHGEQGQTTCTAVLCKGCFQKCLNEKSECPQCRWAVPQDIHDRLANPLPSDGYALYATFEEMLQQKFLTLYEKILHQDTTSTASVDKGALQKEMQDMPLETLGEIIDNRIPQCKLCTTEALQGIQENADIVMMCHGNCRRIMHADCFQAMLGQQITESACCPFCNHNFEISVAENAENIDLKAYPTLFKPLKYTKSALSQEIVDDGALCKKFLVVYKNRGANS